MDGKVFKTSWKEIHSPLLLSSPVALIHLYSIALCGRELVRPVMLFGIMQAGLYLG